MRPRLGVRVVRPGIGDPRPGRGSSSRTRPSRAASRTSWSTRRSPTPAIEPTWPGPTTSARRPCSRRWRQAMAARGSGRIGVLVPQNARLGLAGLGDLAAPQAALWTWAEALGEELRAAGRRRDADDRHPAPRRIRHAAARERAKRPCCGGPPAGPGAAGGGDPRRPPPRGPAAGHGGTGPAPLRWFAPGDGRGRAGVGSGTC